mmetsp:Transcript_26027/g.53271  ORF Transcript_26027/g.53271 Transcript_26027/m.53271 type:complete len:219 (-) Transcript_26027:964-1620(-)
MAELLQRPLAPGRALLGRQDLPLRRRRSHPLPPGGSGDEHGPAGRAQPRLEAGARRERGGGRVPPGFLRLGTAQRRPGCARVGGNDARQRHEAGSRLRPGTEQRHEGDFQRSVHRGGNRAPHTRADSLLLPVFQAQRGELGSCAVSAAPAEATVSEPAEGVREADQGGGSSPRLRFEPHRHLRAHPGWGISGSPKGGEADELAQVGCEWWKGFQGPDI